MLGREVYFNRLMKSLEKQRTEEVEILFTKTPPFNQRTKQYSTGEKRNDLLQKAKGDYVVFVDDDDEVTEDYIETILECCDGVDAIGIGGWYTQDGGNYHDFKTSIHYEDYDTNTTYFRHVNHICPIRREIAQQMKFPHITFGEDSAYSKQLKQSGLLKTEHQTKMIYHYKYRSRK